MKIKRTEVNPSALLNFLAFEESTTKARLLALVILVCGKSVDCDAEKISKLSGIPTWEVEGLMSGELTANGVLTKKENGWRIRVPPMRVKGKKRETPAELSRKLIILYSALWSERYRTACIISGRMRSAAHALVTAIGFEEAQTRIKLFFKLNDEWLRTNRHPFLAFVKNANSYARREREEAEIIAGGDFNREVEEFEKRYREKSKARNATALGFE